jgi:hypothetical protein
LAKVLGPPSGQLAAQPIELDVLLKTSLIGPTRV